MKKQYKLIEVPSRAVFDRSNCDFFINNKCLFVSEDVLLECSAIKTKFFKYIPLLDLKTRRFWFDFPKTRGGDCGFNRI